MSNLNRKVIPLERKKHELSGAGYAAKPRILIPEGRYQAVAVKCKTMTVFGTKRVFLDLNIIELINNRKEVRTVSVVFPVHDEYTPRAKLYKIWSKVMLRVPRRRELISPKDLIGHVYEIRVRTVIHDENQKKIPEYMQYSVAEIEDVAVRNYKPSTCNQ